MIRIVPAIFFSLSWISALNLAAYAQTPVNGGRLFEQNCVTCHGSPTVERAPDISILRKIPGNRIYDALTNGAMKIQAEALNSEQRRAIAEYLGERKLVLDSSADAHQMQNLCRSNPPFNNAAAWNGWGVDVVNSRFQPAKSAGLTA